VNAGRKLTFSKIQMRNNSTGIALAIGY